MSHSVSVAVSIHFISGKPGGGKSLYGVRLIVDELVKGSRIICTNVPLKLGALSIFLQEKFPKAYEEKFIKPGVHISDRVILFEEDDLSKFFTFRGNGVRLESIKNTDWKAGKRPDYSIVNDGGVFYVLDEVHIAFNSRAWADTGAEVLYYLSQHRKLGDDVICITQSVGNVDKQFRSVAQDFTYIKNLSKQNVGLFRLPAMFTRNTYDQPATDKSQPLETGTFTLDVSGMASCYDTAKGVGIHGRAGADTNARKRGLHWAWFAVGVPLLVWAVIHFLPSMASKAISPNTAKTITNSIPQSPKNSPGMIPAPVLPTNSVSMRYAPSNELYCIGYAVLGGRPVVYMSDGKTIRGTKIEKITVDEVTVSGRVFEVRAGSGYTLAPPDDSTIQPEPALLRPNSPVNQATVLPSVSGRSPAPPQALNGFNKMKASPGGNAGRSAPAVQF